MLKSEKCLVSQRRSKQNDPRVALAEPNFSLGSWTSSSKLSKTCGTKKWRLGAILEDRPTNLYWEFWLEQQKLRSKWSVLFSPSICCLQRFPSYAKLPIRGMILHLLDAKLAGKTSGKHFPFTQIWEDSACICWAVPGVSCSSKISKGRCFIAACEVPSPILIECRTTWQKVVVMVALLQYEYGPRLKIVVPVPWSPCPTFLEPEDRWASRSFHENKAFFVSTSYGPWLPRRNMNSIPFLHEARNQ